MFKIDVPEHHVILLRRRGRTVGQYGPGRQRRWGGGWSYRLFDLRPTPRIVPNQEIPTLDGVPVRLSLAIETRIVDAAAFDAHGSPMDALHVAAQIGLRDAVAAVPVDRLIEEREAIVARVRESSSAAVAGLGLTILSLDLRDIGYPPEVRSAMLAVVKAKKEAEAGLERARGESAALRSLLNAARLLEENPGLYHLRALQAVGEKGGTIVIGEGERPGRQRSP